MAIKILSYDSSPNIKYVTTCTCGCKFTFNETDTWIEWDPDPTKPYLSDHCVECPNCKTPVYGSLWYVLDPLEEMDNKDKDQNERKVWFNPYDSSPKNWQLRQSLK